MTTQHHIRAALHKLFTQGNPSHFGDIVASVNNDGVHFGTLISGLLPGFEAVVDLSVLDLDLADNDPVATWGPLSQSDPDLQPKYVADVGIGHPAIHFEADDVMSLNPPQSLSQPMVQCEVLMNNGAPLIQVVVADHANTVEYINGSPLAVGDVLPDPVELSSFGGTGVFDVLAWSLFKGRPTLAQVNAIGSALAAAFDGTWDTSGQG